jgi:ferredoxin
MRAIQFSFFDRHRIPDYDKPSQMHGSAELVFDKEKCKECGTCVLICVAGSISTETASKMQLMSGEVKLGKNGLPRMDRMRKGSTLCLACYDCGAACPHGAISIKQNYNPGYFFKRLTQTDQLTYPKRY